MKHRDAYQTKCPVRWYIIVANQSSILYRKIFESAILSPAVTEQEPAAVVFAQQHWSGMQQGVSGVAVHGLC